MTTRGKLSEAGCFSAPAVRPRLRRREPKSEVQIPQVQVLKILIRNRRIQSPHNGRENVHYDVNGGEKSKSGALKSVAIKTKSDHLFSITCARF